LFTYDSIYPSRRTIHPCFNIKKPDDQFANYFFLDQQNNKFVIELNIFKTANLYNQLSNEFSGSLFNFFNKYIIDNDIINKKNKKVFPSKISSTIKKMANNDRNST
jgi:hypothetical protein